MYSFLVVASQDAAQGDRLLDRSCRITQQLMPTMGRSIACVRRPLPEIGGGWYHLTPTQPALRPIVHEYVDDDVAVLMFGELFDRTQDCAGAMAQVFREGGPEAARGLDGDYSAVIVERHKASVHVFSDALGRRVLRTRRVDDILLIAPYEVPIVATGLCPLDYDPVSACAIMGCDWSVQGRSLLRGVRTARATEVLQWTRDACDVMTAPVLTHNDRLDPADHAGIANRVDEHVQRFRESLRIQFASCERVEAELTAGEDSRAIFAAMQSVLHPDQIVAITRGEPRDLNCRIAAKIAGHAGIRHETRTARNWKTDKFLDHADVLAFFCNGDTNAKRAYTLEPPSTDKTVPAVGGGAGEFYTGPWYRTTQPDALLALTEEDVHDRVRKRFRRVGQLPLADETIRDGVRRRLRDALAEVKRIGGLPVDWMDLYYSLERFSRWACGPRYNWDPVRYTPFSSPLLLRQSLLFPAPTGLYFAFPSVLIKQLMPWAASIPVNGLHALGGKYTCRGKITRFVSRGWRFALRLLLGPESRRPRELHGHLAVAFRSELTSDTRDILADSDGFGAAVLGMASLTKMMDEHIAGKADHLQVLGFLLTMERWRSQVHEAYQAAQDDA